MGLMDVVRALRKRWRVITIFVLVIEGLVALVLIQATPKYTASTQLFITSRDQSNASNNYVQGLTIQALVPSYVNVIDKQAVLQPVVQKLNLPYTWQHLASEVSASTPSTSVLIDITVTDPSARRARDVANAIDAEFATYIQTISSVSGGTSPVKASVSQPAVVPSTPTSPKPALDLIAGLLLGLAGGIVLALVRDALDTSIKTQDEIPLRFGSVSLGSIPFDDDTPKHPVVLGQAPAKGRAEAFRQLRTNLQFVQIDEQPRSIVITSSVSGEGKTTTACNIAVVLAQIGVRVILVEGDLRRPRVAEYLGLESAVGLTSVLLGWTKLKDALQPWGGDGLPLQVLASGPIPPNPSELLAGERMHQTLLELEDAADVVIIDGPPLLPVADSAVLAAAASGSVLVVRQGKTRREQVKRALESLRAVDATVYGIALNMVKRQSGDAAYGYKYDGYASTTDIPSTTAGPPAKTVSPSKRRPRLRKASNY